MSKDQAIGGAILLVCAVIAVLYIVTLMYPNWLSNIGVSSSAPNTQFWIIAIPVAVAFIAILGIGGWIGWTMATTPPPKPIEELQTELKQKEPSKEEASL